MYPKGPIRDLNPGPPAPKAGIIPLDQSDCYLFSRGYYTYKYYLIYIIIPFITTYFTLYTYTILTHTIFN